MDFIECQYKKIPVGVNIYVKRDGQIRPKSFLWKDGNTYEIDKIVEIRKAASTKIGGVGVRYTVLVEGLPRFLYDEDGKWFMEDKVI